MDFTEMISCLRQDLVSQGFRIYDTYKDDIHLPIDLFCSIEKDSKKINCAIIVSSIDNISEDFQKKLLFYQYYLSLNYKPADYTIVLVVSNTAKVDIYPFYEKEGEKKSKDFYKENGIGLWRINPDKVIDKESYSAITLQARINKDFEQFIKTLFEQKEKKQLTIIKEKNANPEDILAFFSSDIHLFVDRYIHDSVKGIAGFNPPKFNKRYIDSSLLERVSTISTITYKKCLCEGISEHLSTKGDDVEFCTNALNNLWEGCVPKQKYPAILKNYESLLKEFFPKYRDHYVHQFQVFLLGAIIIDELIKCGKFKGNHDHICDGWLLAASYHDFSYPIQKYDDYISYFFKETIGIDEPLGLLELKSNYMEYKFSSNIEFIISSISTCFDKNEFKGEVGTEKLNKIREFFYYKIVKNKNHGLLSALGLLKKLETQKSLEDILLPASTAIALHDDEVWQPLHGLTTEDSRDNDEWVKNVRNIAPIKEISFEDHPLAFLLILCDNIQDWGRHCEDEEFEKQLEAANIRLKEVVMTDSKLIIRLYVNIGRQSLPVMSYKEKILQKIEKILKSPTVKFALEFWDREKDEITKYVYNIE